MMGLDSAMVILLAEAFIAILVLGVLWVVNSKRKQGKDLVVIDEFIEQLAEDKSVKNRKLETLLHDGCHIDSETTAVILEEVNAAERALLQRVIQMFLQRDPKLLNEIDELIGDISNPYCKLLVDSAAHSAHATQGSGPDLSGMQHVNQQLVRQLDAAMQTIDEITAEYTRIFNGNQTALELENSSKKMQQIFQDAARQVKQNM